MIERHYRVADLVFQATSTGAPPWEGRDPAYRPFECAAAPPDLRVTEAAGAPPALGPTTRVFASGALWDAHRAGGRTVFTLAPAGAADASATAAVGPDGRQAEVWYHAPHSALLPQPLHPLMFPLFHLLTVNLLTRARGLVLHASGVDADGRGFLFPAVSGGGKTTLARLWRDTGRVLNDERIVVRWRDGAPWIYGTPWHGELAETAGHGVPLAGIFFPRRGDSIALERLRPAVAAARLVPRWLQPCWDAAAMAGALDLVHDLATTTPGYDLAFTPDRRVIERLRCSV